MNLLQSSEPSVLDRALQLVHYPLHVFRNPVSTFLSIPGLSPALSFLIIPTFSSYSTSLNLLFFYLTWSTLVWSNPPLKIELIGTLAIRILFYIIPSLISLLLDSAVPNVAVSIKEHGDGALPLSEEQGGRKGRWWKVALVSIGNVLLGVIIQGSVEYLFTEILYIRSALKASTTIPLPWSIAWDVLRGLLLRELFTYVLHRYTLHSPGSPITQYHISWYHTLPAPYSLTANYDHPIAYVLHNFLPTYIPAVLCRFHLLTYQLYLALISLEEAFAYSGYNILPSALILGGIARRQEQHLMCDGKGNYGCWGIVDFLAGTGIGNDIVDDVREEADGKEEVADKGSRNKGKAKGKGKTTGRRGRRGE